MNLTDQKIENEIKLKRIKPEAFIAQFEKFFNDVAKTYQVTVRETRQQRKNVKSYFKPYVDLNDIMDIGDITSKVIAHAEATRAAVAKGEPVPPAPDYAALEADLNERNRFITDFDTNPQGFKKIMDEHYINQLRNQLTGGALNGLLTSWVVGAFTKLLILGLAIVFAIYIEDPMTTLFKPLGDTQAIVVTTVIVYFTVDLIIDAIKDWLLWERVKTCHQRFKKVREILNP